MTPQAAHHHERRWLILAVLGLAQLMVVLDATIVNIALPSAQADLGFSDDSRQWIVTAYALAFGSLLLLGGRIGDLFGRKWVFIAGLGGFAVASALGGMAQSFEVLVAARALQGLFGALLAPAALSLLTTTFTAPDERNKAFGVFGAIAGSGAAVGLLLGGVLTEWLSWRWCLYVNLAFSAVAIFGAASLLRNEVLPGSPKLDIPGTLTASAGLFGLVYGFAHASETSWTNPTTLGFLTAGVVLLATFVALQRRAVDPLLPLSLLRLPGLAAANAVTLVSATGLFAVWFFLTLFMQEVLGWTPLQAGAGFLPHTFAIILGTQVTTRWLGNRDARIVISSALLLSVAGFVLLWQSDAETGYVMGVAIPGILVMFGAGVAFPPIIGAATAGVGPRQHGVASGVLNTTRMVGGALGLAVLATVAASRTSHVADGGPVDADALVAGFQVAYLVAAGAMLLAAALAWLLPARRRPPTPLPPIPTRLHADQVA
jgi:EmrB/QacA subfamily drug resistance transporter